MASMYDKVVSVTLKPPEERDPRTIEPLLPWFRKRSDVFSSLTTDIVVDIIRNCQFVTRERDGVIIKQGDKGDCFYVILKGTVSIYINNAISDEEDESKIAEHSRGAQFFTEKGELDRSKFGNYIVQFPAGKSFGELALINKNCIRNASIIADESTDLLEVNRELYNRSLKSAQTAEFEERNTFVKEHMLFRSWAAKHKKQLAMSLEKVRIPFEGHICRQGEAANMLYFLLKGQAKILIDGALHPSQFSQFYPLEDPDKILAREELEQDSVQHLSPRKIHYQTTFHERPSAVAPFAQRKRERARKLTELSIVGAKEIIGDAEFALELKYYLQSVECTQMCEVYVLDMKNYERLVTKRNPKSIDVLRQHAEVKLSGRISRLTVDQVPLLKTILFKMERIDRSRNPVSRRRDGPHSPFASGNDVVPQRGPLIDMFGPGTVFYRAKMREQAKKKQKSKQNFRGARVGFAVPVTQISLGRYTSQDDSGAPQPTKNDDVDTDVSRNGTEGESAETDDDEEEIERGFHTDRPILPYGSTFLDYKSSDKALSMLETRIKHWHSTLATPKQRRHCQPSAVKLERVKLEKGKELVPGRTVILRKKRPHGNSLGIHSHVDDSSYRDTPSDHVTRTTSTSGFLITEPHHSTGSTKATLYSRRVQRAEEKAPEPRAFPEFPGNLLTPSMFLRLYLSRPSPSSSDYDFDRPAPPESKGTILDILKKREVIEGKIVCGIHSRAEKSRLCALRSSCTTQNGTRTGTSTTVTHTKGGYDVSNDFRPRTEAMLPPLPVAPTDSGNANKHRKLDSSAHVIPNLAPIRPLTFGGQSASDIEVIN